MWGDVSVTHLLLAGQTGIGPGPHDRARWEEGRGERGGGREGGGKCGRPL